MAETSRIQRYFNELRHRAEEELQGRSPEESPAVLPDDLDALIHELELRQLELEMQNDELRRAQRELEATRERYTELNNRLRRRNQELATLNEFSRTVGSTLDLQTIFTSLEELLGQRFDLPGGCIFSYNAAADSMLLRHHWGFPDAVARQYVALPVSGTHLEPVVREWETVRIEDFREIPLFVETGLAATQPQWQEYLVVPLLTEGEIEGALGLFCAQGNGFSESRAQFLTTLGQQAGIAIEVARLFTEVRTGQERLRHLTRQIVSAQEEERRRVSRDLHDEAGQVLTALKLNLEMIEEDLRTGAAVENEEMRQQLVAAVGLSEKAMARLRNLAHNLRPAVLDDLGLGPALKGLCRDFSRQVEGEIDYRQEGEIPPVSSDAKIVLYRFLQEALTNVVKHARASQVEVILRGEAQMISLIVHDDGVGFDRAQTPEGIGLLGMRERVESVGGQLEIHSIPGDGTRLVGRLLADNT